VGSSAGGKKGQREHSFAQLIQDVHHKARIVISPAGPQFSNYMAGTLESRRIAITRHSYLVVLPYLGTSNSEEILWHCARSLNRSLANFAAM
jgi:hypothetical protein